MSLNIRIFRLNYSGSFDEIPEMDLQKQLTLFNIVVFYNPDQKRLYIWIGKRVSQSLRRYIPRLREIITSEYPELRILRNIIIESGSESIEFLNTINLTEIDIKRQIKNLEEKLIPSLSKISKLRETADKNFISEKYHMAIKVAEKILKLANEINDNSLEMDQKNFIFEAKIRINARKIIQDIKKECKVALNEFQNLINTNKIKEAHKVIIMLKKKYQKNPILYSNPDFQDLLLKDEKLLFNIRTEQKKIQSQLDSLEVQYKKYLNKNYLEKANRVLKDAKLLLNQLTKVSTSKKWAFLMSNLNEANEAFIRRIEILSKEGLMYLDKGKISECLEIFEKIIIELDKSIKVD